MTAALSCRHSDGSSPLSPLSEPEAGSPARPPSDDTTTGHPIGPISKSDVGGFDTGGRGAGGGTGGAAGTGGMGGIVSNQRARQ